MSTGNIGSYMNLSAVSATRAADEPAVTEPTSQQQQVAKDFPAGIVKLENQGLKLGLRIPGGLMALGGATLLGISLLSRGGAGAGASRLLGAPLLVGGGLIGAGAAAVVGAELLPPKSRLAVATNIPTQARAGEIAGMYVGREMKVVQDTSGKWAVLDEGPARSGGGAGGQYGYERGRGHNYGDGDFHGQHYSGDSHDHPRDYTPEPYDTGSGGYYPNPYDPPSYPSNPYPGGGTSRGDDYTPSYPRNPGGGTSRGDDGGSRNDPPPRNDPPRYDPPPRNDPPPRYDPPRYDPPPRNDPPRYDPPRSSSGNSSSNGNPGADDF